MSGINEVLSLLTPSALVNASKVRIGAVNDGGYVMVDDFPKGTIALSFGIGKEVSWDIDMANRGLHVRQYDHTITKPPVCFEFHRVALTKLSAVLTEEAVVKMDVEGAEWDVLQNTTSEVLERARQIVIEFHWMQCITDETFRLRAERAFRLLNETHCPVHVHANNWGGMTKIAGLPETLEMSYASRKHYTFKENTETFPTMLDSPNDPNRPDIALGHFIWN